MESNAAPTAITLASLTWRSHVPPVPLFNQRSPWFVTPDAGPHV